MRGPKHYGDTALDLRGLNLVHRHRISSNFVRALVSQRNVTVQQKEASVMYRRRPPA
jgi:hypothetical protein